MIPNEWMETALASRELPNGQFLVVLPMTFGNMRLYLAHDTGPADDHW
jgi:hypothetical protein